MRSPEVRRSLTFYFAQNLEYMYKQPHQGQKWPNLATFRPKYVRSSTLLRFLPTYVQVCWIMNAQHGLILQ